MNRNNNGRERPETCVVCLTARICERFQGHPTCASCRANIRQAQNNRPPNVDLRACPRCRLPVTFGNGCSHVQCPRCRFHFEWGMATRITGVGLGQAQSMSAMNSRTWSVPADGLMEYHRQMSRGDSTAPTCAAHPHNRRNNQTHPHNNRTNQNINNRRNNRRNNRSNLTPLARGITRRLSDIDRTNHANARTVRAIRQRVTY